MQDKALSENIYKNIPRLAESGLDIVSAKFQISEVSDFDPDGDAAGKSIPWNTISRAVLFRDNYSCRICERSSLSNVHTENRYDKLHISVQVHHIIPRKDGGSDTFRNLVTLCEECHRKTFSQGYAGLPVTGQSTIYNFEYRIKLCIQEPWLYGAGIKMRRAELKDYRRVFDPGENEYLVVPSPGDSLALSVAEITRDQYGRIVSSLRSEFSIYDYITMKVNSENGRESARILMDSRGRLVI